jgi:tricarballylate dehydrogenase
MSASKGAQSTRRADVVVVGAGNAGLTAALAAAEAGAHVIVLESAPLSERGGNTRFSGGIFRTPHNGFDDQLLAVLSGVSEEALNQVSLRPYTEDDYRNDWMTTSDHQPDAELVDIVVRSAFATMQWMHSRGVRWELTTNKLFSSTSFSPGRKYDLPPGGAIRAHGEGVGLSARLFEAAEADPAIEIWYDSPASKLLTSGSTVLGVRVRLAREVIDVSGAVVLAAGGFEANPEMRLRYLGSGWDTAKVRGTKFNMGTMLQEAIAVGAQPVGHWAGCHASPLDANAPKVGDLALTDKYSRYSYPYSVMVNERGERFVDEGENQVWLTYAKTGAAILQQPHARAYQIFDQKTIKLIEPRYRTGTPIVAETIAELAKLLSLPETTLARTIADFNAATSADADARFDPIAADDGVSATPGGQPPKSRWAIPVDTGPFVAYPVTCGITFTYGGVKINGSAQVIDTEGHAMPGLFATGELSGDFFYYNYAGGAGLPRGAVFGRIAGTSAAREAALRQEAGIREHDGRQSASSSGR